jgi:Transposase DDE domain group 1
LAACLKDDRQEGKVRHELDELLTQRIMAIACGYEDANDAARLASDPVHKLLIGRDPLQGEDLASQLRCHVLKIVWTVKSCFAWPKHWPTQ